MKEVSVWRTAFACLLGAALALALYQHFWGKRISAQTATLTYILIPWITGDDAGYSTLLSIQNTSFDPFGNSPVNGSCAADAYTNSTHYGPGSLGSFNAGTTTTLTEAQIATATGISLANSGDRAYLFITCNFPFAQAQLDFINPGGVVTFMPGQVVPSSQTNPQSPPSPKKPANSR
jgi:hypothetical protein